MPCPDRRSSPYRKEQLPTIINQLAKGSHRSWLILGLTVIRKTFQKKFYNNLMKSHPPRELKHGFLVISRKLILLSNQISLLVLQSNLIFVNNIDTYYTFMFHKTWKKKLLRLRRNELYWLKNCTFSIFHIAFFAVKTNVKLFLYCALYCSRMLSNRWRNKIVELLNKLFPMIEPNRKSIFHLLSSALNTREKVFYLIQLMHV